MEMEIFEELEGLYQDYEEQYRQSERRRKPGEGMFGLGRGPGDHPCHGQFAQDMEELLGRYEAQGPAPAEAAQVLDYIYFAPVSREDRALYWMMLAVHALTGELVERLSPEDAGDLLQRYRKTYRKSGWLPAQEKLMAALKKRAKSAEG